MRKQRPAHVDIARHAIEAIALEGFQPVMRRAVERGERFPRDAEMVRAFPEHFALIIPMSALQEVEVDG
jgi:hypothetical protein